MFHYIDPCLIQNDRFNNTLHDLSNLESYSHIFQCQSYGKNNIGQKWYTANLENDCISLFEWVNVTQQQGKL